MSRRALWLFAIACLTLVAQERTSVLIITDAEGVAGICRQEQAEPTNPELQKLLTAEINAAVRGFLSAGVNDVVVWDGHDGSRTLSITTIHPSAKLVMGGLGPDMLMDRKFTAVAFVGQHARANRERAVMAHSYSSLGIQTMRMNGKEVGEIETRTALAGWFETPVIFLSGDRAAAEDLLAIVPNAEVAIVKEGLNYYSCISLSSAAAEALIQEKAASAWRKRARIKPYKLSGPVEIVVESSTRSTRSPDTFLGPGIERIGPRSIRYSGRDFLESWRRSTSR